MMVGQDLQIRAVMAIIVGASWFVMSEMVISVKIYAYFHHGLARIALRMCN